MSARFSDLISLAEKEKNRQKFKISDCKELIEFIQRNSDCAIWPHSDMDIEILCGELNDIDSFHQVQALLGNSPTARKNVARLAAIEKAALELLDQFGMNESSKPSDLPIEHTMPGGIYEYRSHEPLGQEIASVQRIVRDARSRMADFKEVPDREYRKPDLPLFILVNRLAHIYKSRWGKGALAISVNGKKGGPAVRFFTFTIEKIGNEVIKPQAVKDAIVTMKRLHSKGQIDSDFVSNVI